MPCNGHRNEHLDTSITLKDERNFEKTGKSDMYQCVGYRIPSPSNIAMYIIPSLLMFGCFTLLAVSLHETPMFSLSKAWPLMSETIIGLCWDLSSIFFISTLDDSYRTFQKIKELDLAYVRFNTSIYVTAESSC